MDNSSAAHANGASRVAAHRRRQSQHMAPPTPAAPDVPRAPPMSYRDPYASKAADRLSSLRAPPYAPLEPLSGAVERRGSQRKPSVPDRSPLQKLEGKLDDISKEERRARILEAELLAQEKAEAERRERRAREAAERQQQRVEFLGPADPAASASANLPTRPAREQLSSQKQRASSASYQVPHTDAHMARTSSVKGKEPMGVARGSGSFREPSTRPASNLATRAVANPAGLGLLEVNDTSAGAQVTRADSRRISSAPVAAGPPISTDRTRDSRGIVAAQMDMQQQQLDQKASNRTMHPPQLQPLSASVTPKSRKSVGFSEPGLDLQQQSSHDSHHHHHHHHLTHDSSDDGSERRYVAKPLLEEWRMAPIAALGAEDLDLTAPVRTNSTNKAWWEENSAARQRKSSTSHAEPTYDGYADLPATQTSFTPPLYLKCGPLLRYTGLRTDKSRPGKEKEIWRGSVMIVTVDAESSYTKPPTLRLFKQPVDILPPPPREVDHLDPAYVDPVEGQYKVSRTGKTLYVKPVDELAEDEDLSRIEDDTGLFSQTRTSYSANGSRAKSTRIHRKDGEKLGKFRQVPAVRLHAERGVTFWRFNLEVELGSSQTRLAYKINHGPAVGFWVPAKGESMNIMFHSCNGFSLSVDSNQFCGPDPMWRDVLNTHQNRPFHVMIGGGDQIYNDAAMRQTTLFKQWTENKNPLQKHSAPFTEEMQNELEQFYLDRYSMWFSQGLFGMANSQIPMVNIWDDHDIIDGYGSYPHHFMQTPVFTGIGAVAFKYYMLFQHQSVSAETEATEPSWILGKNPGPYIKERSRSVFMHLGREVAFLGLDCRTERQRDEILTEDSYDVIFDRVEAEVIQGETKHLIVLLGVPIAYPRLNFLENILTSRLMDPIKAIGRTGMLGNFVNKFDGGVEILDDLDDHWTAKHHKEERNWLIRELQHIASTKSVRVTILGGDVHLAAVGQFFTNKKLNVPKDKDHRYMLNVVSSAIVNTPPPDMMADIINKRNKIHHMDHETDENMIPIFTHGVDGKKRNNNNLLPHRNWCSIREFKPGSTPPGTPSPPATAQEARRPSLGQMVRRFSSDQGARSRRSRGPPLSYYNNPAYASADDQQMGVAAHQPQSSFSPDRSEKPHSRRNSLSSLFRRRASVDNVSRPQSAKSVPGIGNRSSSDFGPSTFHRRPSVLGRSGWQQQGDYVNLQGGLEICLNMEVSQHDPAGITAPYRLIVPALDYTPPVDGVAETQARKSGMFGAMFGGGKRRNRVKIGDDDDSMSGSDSGSQLGEVSSEEDEEERARSKHRVGPRINIPGFGSKNNKHDSSSAKPAPAENRLSSGYYTNSAQDVVPQRVEASRKLAPPVPQVGRQSMDLAGPATRSSAWESVAAKRHVSAPHPTQTWTYTTTRTTTQTTALPSRSNTVTRKQPTYNSSHKSQLPAPVPASDPKVYRRSMGGILNQHGGEKFEHEAHVLSHTPSRNKRDSYPPHPAIVGGGHGSPYSRGGMGMQARQDAGPGDYFSSGGRDSHPAHSSRGGQATAGAEQPKPRPITAEYAQMPRAGYDRTASYPTYPSRNGSAGVGARYLGRGRYEDDDYDSEDDDDDEDDDRSYIGKNDNMSQESFVPPKKKKKWQIWK
ncbi:hypothetical protein ACEQ8H_005137 [Pleosporales sp. CAS-2024a]